MTEESKPIKHKEEIKQNPDNKIDQDFNGYPSGPATDETINPKTKEDKKPFRRKKLPVFVERTSDSFRCRRHCVSKGKCQVRTAKTKPPGLRENLVQS